MFLLSWKQYKALTILSKQEVFMLKEKDESGFFKHERRILKNTGTKYSNLKKKYSDLHLKKNALDDIQRFKDIQNEPLTERQISMRKNRKSCVWGLAFLLCLMMFNTNFKISIVSGQSMCNTYQDGQVLFVKQTKDVVKNDIVIFEDENLYPGRESVVKRVLATAGDKISCKDGNIYVNGQILKEDYAFGRTADFKEVTISDGHFFVVGDNRENSYDSRVLGEFPIDDLIGKVLFVI